MSYSLGMSSIDDKIINIEKVKEYCSKDSKLVFDDTQSWGNTSDFFVLYKNDGDLDYICDFDKDSTYASCTSPDSERFVQACELAENLNLFIFGEENEIYWIPKNGAPKTHIDFQNAKEVFAENGNINSLIET
jgi:hypothetical protein